MFEVYHARMMNIGGWQPVELILTLLYHNPLIVKGKTYLGADLGGTKLLIGEVNEEGSVVRQKTYPTGFLNQLQARELLINSIDDYLANVSNPSERPVSLGVGLLGRVDVDRGVWEQIDPSRTYPIALAQELRERYGMPCGIDNDVKSATQAEMLWGAGRKSKDFVYINVGTGLAACAVVDGRILRGSHYNAGEVGHTTVGLDVGTQCVCGRPNCVETLAAGIGFDMCARLLQSRYPTRLAIPEDGSRVSVKEVFRLAREEGDALCEQLVANASEALSQLVMNLVRMSDPDTVVMGGSIMMDGYMLERMQAHLQAETMRFVTNGVQLTTLNPHYIGLLGAAVVGINQIQ